MIKELTLPELAEGVTSAVVVGILVKPGDRVTADQIAVELENEKATAELPVPFAGTVKEILKKDGDTVNVGEALLTVEVDGERAADETPSPAAEKPAPAPAPAPEPAPATAPVEASPPPATASSTPAPVVEPDTPPAAANSKPVPTDTTVDRAALPAGPETRRLARELGADLAAISGTGPRGRIQPEDVKQWVRDELARLSSGGSTSSAGASTAASVTEKPMSGVRRKTAEVTAASWREIPHVVQHDKADITALEALRAEWKAAASAAGRRPPTVTGILLKVVAAALRAHPQFNSSVDMEGFKVLHKNYVHIAVAVETGHGLLTPVIRDADRKSVATISEELAGMAAKAREKKLGIEEMTGGCFSVSNLGGFGTTAFGRE